MSAKQISNWKVAAQDGLFFLPPHILDCIVFRRGVSLELFQHAVVIDCD
jgi:hypothetical protein